MKRWPRPQGIDYRGSLLAEGIHFLSDIKTVTADLSEATANYVDPDCQTERVTLKPLGVHPVKGTSVKLFSAKNAAGVDICSGEHYVPSPRERQLLGCPAEGDCDKLEHLRGAAMLIPGAWVQGAWSRTVAGNEVSTLSCVTGATGKCVLWGYIPGESHNGTELTGHYRACVEAARAMYLDGDNADNSYTCADTEIEIYDNLGIQTRQTDDYTLESLWTAEGPQCLLHARYLGCQQELGTLLNGNTPCVDPAPRPGDDWSPDAASEALIAVGSSTSNNIGICPSQKRCRWRP